jgi:hypothetical protein
MEKFFYYIDKFKYGILAALATYVLLFTYMQLKYFDQLVPIERMFNESHVDIPDDEIELKPENIQVAPEFQGGEVKNTTKDLNDKRLFSEKNWSQQIGNQQNKQSGNNDNSFSDERKHLEEIKKQVNERINKTVPIKSTSPSNSNSSSGSKFAFKGNVLVSYDVPTRTESTLEAPGYSCKRAGKVAIKIRVDSYGGVTSVKFDVSKSNGADQCMIDLALSYAKSRSKFTGGSGNADGYIYYTFVAQ